MRTLRRRIEMLEGRVFERARRQLHAAVELMSDDELRRLCDVDLVDHLDEVRARLGDSPQLAEALDVLDAAAPAAHLPRAVLKAALRAIETALPIAEVDACDFETHADVAEIIQTLIFCDRKWCEEHLLSDAEAMEWLRACGVHVGAAPGGVM